MFSRPASGSARTQNPTPSASVPQASRSGMTTRDVEAVASAVARATWQTIQQAVQSTSGTSCRSEASCHIDRQESKDNNEFVCGR